MSALAFLVGLNSAAVAQDRLRIASGLKGTWENSVSELGQDAGFFKKYGLVLDIYYTQGAAETQQAVISGSADIGTGIGAFNTFGAFAKGAPIRVIAATHTGANDLTWYVRADSSIKEKKDLAGGVLPIPLQDHPPLPLFRRFRKHSVSPSPLWPRAARLPLSYRS
jgi:NitT/TauT family transport system substrate-binding protein